MFIEMLNLKVNSWPWKQKLIKQPHYKDFVVTVLKYFMKLNYIYQGLLMKSMWYKPKLLNRPGFQGYQLNFHQIISIPCFSVHDLIWICTHSFYLLTPVRVCICSLCFPVWFRPGRGKQAELWLLICSSSVWCSLHMFHKQWTEKTWGTEAHVSFFTIKGQMCSSKEITSFLWPFHKSAARSHKSSSVTKHF